MVLPRGSQSEYQSALNTAHQSRNWHGYSQSAQQGPFVLIVFALHPGNEAEKGKDLGLDLKSNVEVFNNVIDPKRHSSTSPEKHHSRLQAFGVVSPVVDDNLWNELDL